MFFPLNLKKSNCVEAENTRVKDGLAPYLLWVRGMLGPGQDPSLEPLQVNIIQTQVAHMIFSI